MARVETKIYVFVFLQKFHEIFFPLFAKKAYKNFRFCVSVCKNFWFQERFRENFLFGMRIWIQQPLQYVSISETLVENFCGKNFFRKNKIFHENKNYHDILFRKK
jgi:hypothetical protein